MRILLVKFVAVLMLVAICAFASPLSFAGAGEAKTKGLGSFGFNSSCYALTILKGQTPEKVKVKIIGETKNPFFSNGRIFLAEMQHKMPVVDGMSGSPVYCGDKFVGSLSFRMGAFPVGKALAGITPIEDMREQKKALGMKSPAPGTATGLFRPIAIPVSVNVSGGGAPEILSELNRGPFSENAVFVPGGGSKPIPAEQHLGTVAPGDSVTMFLSRGAVELGATCTVTEVTAKSFLLCGHSFLGLGEVALPAYRSTVAATFKSSYESYKVAGDTLEPVGTVVYDNAFGVEGARELRPNIMLPVKLSVTADSEKYEYNFKVFRHKFYSSSLVNLGTRLLLGNLWADTKLGTAKLSAKIYLRGKDEPVDIYDASLVIMQREQLGFLEGYADPWEILSNFQQTLAAIQQSEWNFFVEKVDLALDIKSGNRVLMLDSMAILDKDGKPTDEIRTGDRLTVILGMRNEDSSERLVRKFFIDIPRDLHLVRPLNEADVSLPATLTIMSGTKYQELDPKKLPKNQPDSAEEFLRALRLNRRNPSEVFAVLVLPPEYQSDGDKLASFPELFPDSWNRVKDLDFLRERKNASEPRVIYVPLGAPEKDAVVSFSGRRQLKFILK